MVKTLLTHALDRMYIDFEFSGNAKQKASLLVQEIRSYFNASIKRASWMDHTTQTVAMKKVFLLLFSIASLNEQLILCHS